MKNPDHECSHGVNEQRDSSASLARLRYDVAEQNAKITAIRHSEEQGDEEYLLAGRGRYAIEALMELKSIVVVSLHTPREKIWGELLVLHNAGITMRGIDLNCFDDFVRQVLHPEGDLVGLATLFFPMQRIERISLDEPNGSIPSLADIFQHKVGRSLKDYLALFA